MTPFFFLVRTQRVATSVSKKKETSKTDRFEICFNNSIFISMINIFRITRSITIFYDYTI